MEGRTLGNRVSEFRVSRAIDINRFLSLGFVMFDLCVVGAHLVGV